MIHFDSIERAVFSAESTIHANIDINVKLLRFGQLPTREEEMAHNPVNINRLTALTGWRPSCDIATGVEHTLAWLERGVGGTPQPADEGGA